MAKTNEMKVKQWGKRNGDLLTKYTSTIYLKPSRVAVGHIVEMAGNDGQPIQYLECTSFQLDPLNQPSFRNVTREIREYEARVLA